MHGDVHHTHDIPVARGRVGRLKGFIGAGLPSAGLGGSGSLNWLIQLLVCAALSVTSTAGAWARAKMGGSKGPMLRGGLLLNGVCALFSAWH